ncbi:unnamed protein product [Adineta steineri]|uniref:Uncharacterized protein n=1 Tax=Adineta steineri TaxID=433720 RepID=A0A813QE71_9BILA|nr:unnamed protein product [Adineta steineri]CAF3506504.1 unnamed protein product [Adineta steineri]
MLRVIRQVANEEQNLTTIMMPTEINSIDTNVTNGSLMISTLPSSLKKQGFLWEFNLNLVILSVLSLIFVIFLIGISIWYACNRKYRVRRQHSLPLTVDDFIETKKISQKRLSSSPIKDITKQAPPIPPRPTAYTTILGKVEYRSNL